MYANEKNILFFYEEKKKKLGEKGVKFLFQLWNKMVTMMVEN